MPVKRRKLDETPPTTLTQSSTAPPAKPLSAIAAAKLRAEAATKAATIQETTLEPLIAPSSPSAEDLVSEYEEAESSPEPVRPVRNLKLCNWQNHPKDVFLENETELSINLDKNTTIALVGHFDFRVSRGAVNINGANLGAVTKDGQKARMYRAFVPATHPILKIRGLDSKNHVQFLSCPEPMPLSKMNPQFEDIWNIGSRGERRRTFGIITSSEEDPLERPLKSHASPEDWLRAIEDCASEPSTTLVTGPPESGKSTFIRRLANRHLTGMGRTKPAVPAVCYLDLDPTKPEFSPPGQISLVIVRELNMGPTFTHPSTLTHVEPEQNEVVRSHAVPLNLANYQDHYRECIEDLYLAYKNLYSRDSALPLLVDIPAVLYSLHFTILEQLLVRIKPQNIVHVGDTRAIEPAAAQKLHSLETICKRHRGSLHEITAQTPALPQLRSEKDLRDMTMQSYFHLSTPASSLTASWSPAPLSTQLPWEFHYRTSANHAQDIVGILPLGEPVPPSSLLHYLAGSVVHIVQSSSAQIPTPYTKLPRTPKSQIPYFPTERHLGYTRPLDPRSSRVLCAALIRGIDPKRGVLQVLVPRALEDVMIGLQAERTIFVAGCVETPEWAYVEDAYLGAYEEEMGERKVGSSCEKMGLWAEREEVVDGMGYLNTVRRVRKFITGEKDEGKGKA